MNLRRTFTAAAAAAALFATSPSPAMAQGTEHHCKPAVAGDVSVITRVFAGAADTNCRRARTLERYVATHVSGAGTFYVRGHPWIMVTWTPTTKAYEKKDGRGALVYVTSRQPTG